MFVGHYGIAFALKRVEPRISLGTLFLAAGLVDVLWGGTVLLGWEHVNVVPGFLAASPFEFVDFPITHSLLGAFGWGIAAALVYFSWPTRNVAHHWRAALIVGLAVLSHWPVDWLVHSPDLPLSGGDSAKYGFGLWRSVPLTLVAEFGLLAIGVALYATLDSRRHPTRPLRLALLLAVLVALLLASTFGPVPEQTRFIGIGAIVLGLLAAGLAAWTDRRVPEAVAHGSSRQPV